MLLPVQKIHHSLGFGWYEPTNSGMIVKTFGIPQSTMALQSEVLRLND